MRKEGREEGAHGMSMRIGRLNRGCKVRAYGGMRMFSYEQLACFN
jgi:hypothetical protein